MGGIIKRRIPRVKRDILKRLKDIPTAAISDSMNRMNTMHADIKPLVHPVKIIAGQAVTVQAMVGCNVASHEAIYVAEKGDIIVFDARGHLNTSVWGAIQTVAAKKRGIGGVVIDGSVRDIGEIKRLCLQVFCKGITPAGPHKGWSDSINVPISCAGVSVRPGDVIVGDEDGIAVIPYKKVSEIMERALATMKKEQSWIKKINKGIPTTRILGLDKKIKRGSL